MSVQSAEYLCDMRDVIKKLEAWRGWSPELEKAIEIIKKTIQWADNIQGVPNEE